MNENKRYRKDNLSPQDSTKRVYKMYKKKKNWVIAPVLFGLLAPGFLTAGTVLADEVTAETAAPQEEVVAQEEEAAEEVFRYFHSQMAPQLSVSLTQKPKYYRIQ